MQFPVFPLNGAILFPGTNLPLNNFEERYLKMVDYALSNDRLIGIIQTKKNKKIFDVGCLGKILHYNNSLIKKSVSLNKKLLLSFKNFIDFKKINFNTSGLSALDTLNLVKIICVISPLDYLIKQMMLELNNVDELCDNLLSVLEIEINNKNNSFKVN